MINNAYLDWSCLEDCFPCRKPFKRLHGSLRVPSEARIFFTGTRDVHTVTACEDMANSTVCHEY